MKRNLNVQLMHRGKPATGPDGQQAMASDIVANLLETVPGNFRQQMLLARKVLSGETFDVDAEDITLIKNLVSERCAPFVAEQIVNLLETDPAPTE